MTKYKWSKLQILSQLNVRDIDYEKFILGYVIKIIVYKIYCS